MLSAISLFAAAHIVSGNAFFSGLILTFFALGLRLSTARRWCQTSAFILLATGFILFVCSATPLPLWAYAGWFGVTLGPWIFRKRISKITLPLFLALTYGLGLAGWEYRYHIDPVIVAPEGESAYVLGDSLSLGMLPPEKNWPEQLGDLLGHAITSYSTAGAKMADVIATAQRIKEPDALVILEIGGNDLLYDTPHFKSDLNNLLRELCRERRRVVLLELPLPPTYNYAGRAQRTLAARHGATLIPKHCLASVLSTPGATIDGLHLSGLGHRLLAEKIAGMFSGNHS